MKLKPVNDKIVVKKQTKEEEVTEAGILLPDSVDQGKLMEGVVVAASEGMYSAQGTLIPLVVSKVLPFKRVSSTFNWLAVSTPLTPRSSFTCTVDDPSADNFKSTP